MKESMGWKQDAARLQALGSQPGQAAQHGSKESHGSDPYGLGIHLGWVSQPILKVDFPSW